MKKERRVAELTKMHKQLTDPEEREKAKRITERVKRVEEKKQDAGL